MSIASTQPAIRMLYFLPEACMHISALQVTNAAASAASTVYCTAQCTPSTSCTSRNHKKDTPHSTGGLGGSLLVQHCIEVCCCFHLESPESVQIRSCSQHATVASHVGMQQFIALHQRRPAFAQHAHWTRKTCVCASCMAYSVLAAGPIS
jgi:hypothetical protein